MAWDYDTANVADNAFRTLITDFTDEMVVFTDMAFHSTDGDPPNQKACKRGSWNGRMVVETVLSMLTTVCRLKKWSQRTWEGVGTRLPYTMAVFNVLVQWDGLPIDADGTIHLSIAQFSL
ncbi:MAG: hypothetical protein H0X37_07390 [Herpetosiphonaceae bacterium]|nr:hypothetical protein [Herpetosiphonaceae bacterium]